MYIIMHNLLLKRDVQSLVYSLIVIFCNFNNLNYLPTLQVNMYIYVANGFLYICDRNEQQLQSSPTCMYIVQGVIPQVHLCEKKLDLPTLIHTAGSKLDFIIGKVHIYRSNIGEYSYMFPAWGNSFILCVISLYFNILFVQAW